MTTIPVSIITTVVTFFLLIAIAFPIHVRLCRHASNVYTCRVAIQKAVDAQQYYTRK